MSLKVISRTTRLPNNLFREYAGTEVGSDLIILQKNSSKSQLQTKEKDFIKSEKYNYGIYNNGYYNDFKRVVHTENFIDTDPYGKPAQVFIHKGGIDRIAGDLKKMLQADLAENLNLNLYQKNKPINKLPTHLIGWLAFSFSLFTFEL